MRLRPHVITSIQIPKLMREIIGGKALTLHMANPVSISGTACFSPSIRDNLELRARNKSWAQLDMTQIFYKPKIRI